MRHTTRTRCLMGGMLLAGAVMAGAIMTGAIMTGAAAAPDALPDALPDNAVLDPLAPGPAQRTLQDQVPPGWVVSAISVNAGMPQIVVTPAPFWRGSPLTASIGLCPDPDSPVWQDPALAGGVLRLVVHYHNRDWPPYDCRP